jgi:hypothetical protein
LVELRALGGRPLFGAALGSTTTRHSAAAPLPVRQKVNPGGAASGGIAAMSIWVVAFCETEIPVTSTPPMGYDNDDSERPSHGATSPTR